jgi:hypothetical protein
MSHDNDDCGSGSGGADDDDDDDDGDDEDGKELMVELRPSCCSAMYPGDSQPRNIWATVTLLG